MSESCQDQCRGLVVGRLVSTFQQYKHRGVSLDQPIGDRFSHRGLQQRGDAGVCQGPLPDGCRVPGGDRVVHGHPGSRYLLAGFLILPECEQIGVGVIVEVAGFDSDVGERLSGFSVSGQSIDLGLLCRCQFAVVKDEDFVGIGLPAFECVAKHGHRAGLGHCGQQAECRGGFEPGVERALASVTHRESPL